MSETNQAAAEPTVTLEEWCRNQSATDRRVELLAAFYRDEAQAGNTLDTPAAFADRLAAFADRPA